MQLTIISGSHRANSNSRKIAHFLAKTAASDFTQCNVLDLHELNLPMWDEGVWKGEEKWKTAWSPIAAQLQASDAVALVAPEWAGMVPPALKNFLLLCGNAELGHKPAMIVGVSSGMGGAYPIAELRMSGYKNNRMVYIPDHMVIRDATNLLNGDTPANKVDEDVRARMAYSTRVLAQYAKALAMVRASGVIDYKTYPFGQ
jgi:NAD(P)H-dependent FMN reductase